MAILNGIQKHYMLKAHKITLKNEVQNLSRFIADDINDVEGILHLFKLFLSGNFDDDGIKIRGRNRELTEVDPTIPESYFEQAFIDVYGRESLDKVKREFPIIDINGGTRWIDYVIRHKDYLIAIEKNGETYHHPIITGKKQYNSQLLKQNSIVAYGYKVFRWSLESMRSYDNFREELKIYLGDSNDFLLSQKLCLSREFKLFEHQIDTLSSIETERLNGKKCFLVVLPTGTGKTEIMISDYIGEYKKNNSIRALIIVPGKNLKSQIIDKFKHRFNNLQNSPNITVGESPNSKVVVQTYSWMSRHYQEFPSDYFQYFAVDEAHHAVAPTVQKVIQHFNPDSLIGLTATNKRLDTKKLEDVFGKYETDLSLFEAIEKGLLAPIKAFRVKSNIDLSQIRFNGKDYVSTDLQKGVIVPSRDQLVVDVLKKYFVTSGISKKSGVVFCVSVKHAIDMAKRMKENGISAMAVSGSDNKSASYIQDYQEGKIQFLTTCSLLNEGWDSPHTSVIVMARPTMSKVLYTQQIGRGTRKCPGKECLYIIDVVDNYGGCGSFNNNPWSIHALLKMDQYAPWIDVLSKETADSQEEIILSGLYEEERKLEKVDIFTFEEDYPNHINDEQLARELFVSTDTIKSWVKKKKISPDVIIPFGLKKIYYFSPSQIDEIRNTMNLKKHDVTTVFDDFFEYLKKGNYTFSYKLIMMFSLFKVVDHNGECNLDVLVDEYVKFYKNRIDLKLLVDKERSPYNNLEFLNNRGKVKLSLLQNPFEKFERKRFMYHCKDLNHISFSSYLWKQISNGNIEKIKDMYFKDLMDYYVKLGDMPDEDYWKEYWGVLTVENTAEDNVFVRKSKIIKIVSGGQTGADRGGLDAAIELDIPHGGWCPKGRFAEDGVIPAKYNMKEMRSKAYLKRTEQNVIDSIATVVLCHGIPKRGSKQTAGYAEIHSKPCLTLDLNNSADDVKSEFISWIESLHNEKIILNVAGARESRHPGLHNEICQLINNCWGHNCWGHVSYLTFTNW